MKHSPYAGQPAVKSMIKALAALQARGITAAEVAKRLGYTPQMIAMLKGGAAPVPTKKIAPLAEALEIEPARFAKQCVASYYPHLKEMLK